MSEPAELLPRTAVLTERGARSVNQDAVLAATLPGGAAIIAVADGMGGQAAGEVASRVALGVLETALRAGEPLQAAIEAANAAVLQEARAHPEYAGMGTTVVAIHRTARQYTIANVGDSRAYRIDRHGIHQITLDHSFMAEAERSGSMAVDEAARSPWRHAVTRAVGTAEEVQVDCFGPHDADEPHTVLLCTDGLYRVLSPDAMRDLIRRSNGTEPAAHELVSAAQRAGSTDNISLALVEFGPAVQAERPRPKWREVARLPQSAKRRRDWKSAADTVIFSVLLILVIYLAIAALLQ